MKKKILVTGGAGFIGSHVVDYLIKEGHDITVLDDLSGGLKENLNPKAKFFQGSITDGLLVEDLMKGKDIVYHLAAYAAEGLSHFVRKFNYSNNLIGSLNLINAAIKNNVECFVFTSSMAVYGTGKPPFDENDVPNPEDPYGISKYAVELDLKCANKLFGINYVVIRPHNIYGERQFLGDPYRNVIGIFMNRIMQGYPPLIYGDGKQTRAFSYIGDVAPCIAKAPFIKEAKNQTFNLGAGKPHSINALAKEVIKAMNSEIDAKYVPKRHEVLHAYCTTTKSEKILGFKDSTSLQEGLSKMAKWAKERGPMQPIIWEEYEVIKNLPEFWKNLKQEFPNSNKRIDIDKINPHK